MPLTPEDVHNKQFTTVRLREGYDEEEVDAFLDEVEGELTRLLRENEELRAKLAAATRAAAQAQQQAQQAQQQAAQQSGPMDRGGPGPMDRPPMDRSPVPMDRMPQRREPQPIPQQLPAPMPMAMAVPQQQFQPVQPGGDSAARVLALAQQTADQAIAEARNEANKIVGEARTRADGLEREARNKAEALERDAQDKHRVAMGTLEQARSSLERKVEDLRAFEREYRQRLKSYLESQMRQLESNSSDDSALARNTGSSFGGGVPQLGPGPSASQNQAPPQHQQQQQQPQQMPGMPGMGGMSGMGGMGGGMSGFGQSGPQPSYAAAAPNPGMPAPAMAGSAMSQMTQTMAPIRPGVPPQPNPGIPQAPSPMRGFLIDEDPES
jgi:DivIVA domain-containing protein